MNTFDKKLIDTVALRKVTGRFGVEIEVEGERLPENVYGWDVHREGSLRGEAKEFVTQGAKDYEDLEDNLLILNQVTDALGSVIHDSHRASVHIHVNCQQQTNREIIGAILAFTMVEPVFMRLCGDTRDGNLFCLPSYDCGDLAAWMDQIGGAFKVDAHWAHIMKRGKYSSLNTDPLTKFGTLEFRTFPTSTDPDRILKWARWCDVVVKIGADFRDPVRDIAMFCQDPMPALIRIFGDDIAAIDRLTLDRLVDIGSETAYDAAVAFFNALELKKAA